MPSNARKWLNRHQTVVTLGSLILMGGAIAFVVWRYQPKPPPPPGDGYFYDTVAKSVFIDKLTRTPPFTTGDGHVAVRANFFSCGDCTDRTADAGGERFIGYYEKYSDEALKKFPGRGDQPLIQAMMAAEGKLYSSDGEAWVAADSPEGKAMHEAAIAKCPAGKLRLCFPALKPALAAK